jgi:hypothetical protein
MTFEDHVEFEQASFWNAHGLNITWTLKIEVRSIRLIVHPLSTVINLLCNRIEQLYEAIRKDTEFPRAKYYKEGFTALR